MESNIFHLQVGSLVIISASYATHTVPSSLVEGAFYHKGTSYSCKFFYQVPHQS